MSKPIGSLRREIEAYEERERRSRELFDTIGQRVFALAMQIGAARAELADDNTFRTAERLVDAERDACAAARDLAAAVAALDQPKG